MAIKSTQMDGDLAVGRNFSIGGAATIQGKTIIKGSLTVAGWLDAKNVKGPNKGIFTTVEKLREAYPLPHDGWWALVGSTLPAELYICEGGDWVDTGETAGNPTIDSEQYNEALAEVQADVAELQQDVEDINTKLSQHDTQITAVQNTANAAVSAAEAAQSDVDDLSDELTAFKNTKGKAGGLAPLDSTGKVASEYLPSYVDDVKDFGGFDDSDIAVDSTTDKSSTDEGCSVIYLTLIDLFVLRDESGLYYAVWSDADLFGTQTGVGVQPEADKVYVDSTTNKTYRWSGETLVIIGADLALGHTSQTAFPGDEGADLQDRMETVEANQEHDETSIKSIAKQVVARSVVNVNQLFQLEGKEITFSVALDKVDNYSGKGAIQIPGVILTFLTSEGWQSKQWTNSADWNTESNWTDFGANGSDVGNTINVNYLCEDKNYTLSTAIQAVLDLESESGFSYMRSGVILTYRTADTDENGAPVWESYQFTREVADIDPADTKPWIAYGSGGSGGGAEVSDTPEKDGTKALSTGGAYTMQEKAIGDFEESQDDDYIYYKAVNVNGTTLDDIVIKIPRSSGGSDNVSTLAIYFQEAAPTVAYGADIKVYAAIRSVSYDGGNEVLGVIKNISVIDASTGLTLSSEDMNVVGSASATDYKFEIDFTSYFSGAASKSFYVQATDADGNVKKKAITIVAVDVTVEQPMALNYTASTALTVGGSTKSIGNFYKFPNNSSSILATVEMYYGGEWKVLGQATVSDSYTKSISVNPTDVFGGGEKLTHGAWPVRIYGQEVKSGVKGNTIYSAIMCVDPDDDTPIVAIRFNDSNNGTLRLYDTLSVDVAAYTPGKTQTDVDVYFNDDLVTSLECLIAETLTVSKQVQGYATDGSQKIIVHAESGSVSTNEIEVTIQGSAIGAELKEGALFALDFSTRSNSETDHTIADGDVGMTVTGANWSSNGFIEYLGEQSLRIAENVKAEITGYKPFGNSSVEATAGCAIQFAFATKNIKDADAKLIDCYDPDSGAGFYVCGNRVAIYCKNGHPDLAERSFQCGEKITMAVVVEPSTIYVTRGGSNYSCMKLYLNGEEVGCIGYISGSGAILNTKTITFDGTDGDLYLYYILGYESYYEWAQAFQNYLCKLTDTDAMIEEYNAEDVLDSQNRPTIDQLAAKEIPYYVVVASQTTFDTFDGDIDTSTKFSCTLYYYHPTMPWRSFKAENVQWRRQGTTSAKRPIKNDRFYLRKNTGWSVTPIYPDYDNDDAKIAYALMEQGYVRVGENSIPVSIITVKVDYSDSSNSNDCGVCDLMNATFRALGSDYMTPVQRAFDGTWTKGDLVLTGLELNHSTANHPIAAFRSTLESLTDAWFHAKGNWKEDKGEQVALGFQDTPGYNLGCVNYGDFVEYFGTDGETLDEIEARFRADGTVDTGSLYLLSLYCGQDYRFMKYENGDWAVQSGEMKQVNGKWQVTGTVLNPVTGYELLTYDGLNWWQGVGSVDDMMAPITAESDWVTKLGLGQATYPQWTRYFECMVDDDQLAIDLAMGRKVPYDLYQVLKFCDSCDYSKDELADTWQEIWKTQMWKYINPYSLIAYYLFTDYLAAVDQQAKNMQPMFFLEDGCSVKDGVYSGANGMEARRMYLNKVYDCDTCNGKDNDGGQTIDPEVDPGDLTSTAYAGRGSVLWNDIRGQQTMEVDAAGNTVTLLGIASVMRSLPDTLGIGAGPFSPAGALYYFVTSRTKKWPKLVSSYDGERKYINYTGYSDLYFYALQGLGLTSLPQFIEQRWRIRDGYYRCGDFKSESGYIGGRIGALEGAEIRFRAAKTGYFGIGNDSGNITEGMYLQEGEEGVFTEFQHGENIMLYIYQADRMSMIDLSQISIDPQFGNTLSKMSLLQELYIGGEDHSDWVTSPGNTGFMTTLDLGDMPFLTTLDIRNTEVKSVSASTCPRLEAVYASGTSLSTISLAETSPINVLELPDTMTEIVLNNLPNLKYPGGLTIEGMGKVTKVYLNECPNIDTMTLLEQITSASALKTVRIPDVNVTASVDMLRSIMSSGAIGLDANGNAYDESGQCSGITGRWIVTELIEESELSEIDAYFPELSVYNAQFSQITFSDEEEDSANISNIDNKTGYLYGNTYQISGYFAKLVASSHAYRAQYNSLTGKMSCKQLSDSDYNYYADGNAIDLQDTSGVGYDIMKLLPKYWYKGVNDFKNQTKHMFLSTMEDEPMSTATQITRKTLSEILLKETSSVFLSNNAVGEPLVISDNSNHNVYSIDVEGMKQVRFPGVNSELVGGAFLDENDNVLELFNMYVTHSLFDFVAGDYLFTTVPQGAKRFVFSSQIGFDDQEAIAVDSDAVEAIEPDWVHTNERLVGVYGGYVDALGRLRSISGVKTTVGTGTATTNAEWTYDSDGKITNASAPTTTMNYTMKDFQNLVQLRGEGFQLEDYEMSKDIANIMYAILGTRDVQSVCGYGCSAAYATGSNSWNDMGNTTYKGASSGVGNLVFGFQNKFGCNAEWNDNVAVNVASYTSFIKNKGLANSSADSVDRVWHILDPFTGTEREVTACTATTTHYCIARVKFGRYCDVIASKMTTDDTDFNKWYSDSYYYNASTGRVVLRAGGDAVSRGGVAYSGANNVSSGSNTSSGGRLAFVGEIEIED